MSEDIQIPEHKWKDLLSFLDQAFPVYYIEAPDAKYSRLSKLLYSFLNWFGDEI